MPMALSVIGGRRHSWRPSLAWSCVHVVFLTLIPPGCSLFDWVYSWYRVCGLVRSPSRFLVGFVSRSPEGPIISSQKSAWCLAPSGVCDLVLLL